MKLLSFVAPLLLAIPSVIATPITVSSIEKPAEIKARQDMAIGGIRVYTSNNNGMNRIRILGGLRVISPALRTVFSEGGRGLELARAFFGDFQDTVIDMFADYQAIWKPAASEGASIIGLQWETTNDIADVIDDIRGYFFDNNHVPVSPWPVNDAFAAGGSLQLGDRKRSELVERQGTCSRIDFVSLFAPWIEWDEGAPLTAGAC